MIEKGKRAEGNVRSRGAAERKRNKDERKNMGLVSRKRYK